MDGYGEKTLGLLPSTMVSRESSRRACLSEHTTDINLLIETATQKNPTKPSNKSTKTAIGL